MDGKFSARIMRQCLKKGKGSWHSSGAVFFFQAGQYWARELARQTFKGEASDSNPALQQTDKKATNKTLPEQTKVTINCSESKNNNPPNKGCSPERKNRDWIVVILLYGCTS